jgi:hypothetical protein
MTFFGRCNYHVAEVNGYSTTIGVNSTYYDDFPGNIAVTVCSTYGGWHCGTPQNVQ